MLPVNNIQVVYIHLTVTEQHLHALEADCERYLHVFEADCERNLHVLEAD
jgi:hypothetical protein